MLDTDRLVERLDTLEVYEDGELLGYALVEKGKRELLSPVRCCRTCAWSHLPGVKHVPGVGIRGAA